jgi:uncharacterized protein YcbX
VTVAEVAWLTIAPVKGLALVEAEEVLLTRDGVADNRRFWLVDDDGRMYAQLRDGRLARVRPTDSSSAFRTAPRSRARCRSTVAS